MDAQSAVEEYGSLEMVVVGLPRPHQVAVQAVLEHRIGVLLAVCGQTSQRICVGIPLDVKEMMGATLVPLNIGVALIM